MRRQPARLYADTSVFGGVFDAKFASDSAKLLAEIKAGRFALVTSTVVQDEAAKAPEPVQRLFATMLQGAELVELSDEVAALRDAYLATGIVGERRAADALHVALATVSRCDVLVSWNFRHIVHLDKARRYNAVNALQGYPSIAICAPSEVIQYEEEEV